MHRSKLSTFLIDCRTDDVAGAVEFWNGNGQRPTVAANADGHGERPTADGLDRRC